MRKLLLALLLVLPLPLMGQAVSAYGGNQTILFAYTGTANGATAGNPVNPPSPLVQRNCTTNANQDCSKPVQVYVAGDTAIGTYLGTADTALAHASDAASLVFVTKWLSGNFTGMNTLRLFLGPSNNANAWCTGGNAGAGGICYPGAQQPPMLFVMWYRISQASVNMCNAAAAQCKWLLMRCFIGGTGCKTATSGGHIAGNANGHMWFMWTTGLAAANAFVQQDSGLDNCTGGCNTLLGFTNAALGDTWRGIAIKSYRDMSTGCGINELWTATDAGGWTQVTLQSFSAPTQSTTCGYGYGGDTGHFEQQYFDLLFNTFNAGAETGANVLAFIGELVISAGPPSGQINALLVPNGSSAPPGW